MVTAKKGPAQAGPWADRPASGDFNPPPHGYTVHSTSTIVYENGYYSARQLSWKQPPTPTTCVTKAPLLAGWPLTKS